MDRFREYKGRILGALVGLIAAILLLCLGFWRTLLILILVGTGAAIGYIFDDRDGSYRSMSDMVTSRKKNNE